MKSPSIVAASAAPESGAALGPLGEARVLAPAVELNAHANQDVAEATITTITPNPDAFRATQLIRDPVPVPADADTMTRSSGSPAAILSAEPVQRARAHHPAHPRVNHDPPVSGGASALRPCLGHPTLEVHHFAPAQPSMTSS